MKKFFTQQINFAYAVMVMLALTVGLTITSAAVTPGDVGPNTISPLIHVGGGEQAIDGLRIGTCSAGRCLGSFDARGNLQNMSVFETIEGLSPLFLVLQNVGVSNKLFVGPNAGVNTALWTQTYGTGAARFSIPLQTVNVFGNARATNLSNTTPNAPVCVDREGVLRLCSGGMTQPTKINGSCGSSHGGNFNEPPTTNLCNAGTASGVNTNPSTYTWTCSGINGGTNASCQATRSIATNGSCRDFGVGPFQTQPANSSNGCLAGTYSDTPADTQFEWKWSCLGAQGGQNTVCQAPRTGPAVNGQCKTYSGVHASQPAVDNPTGCLKGSYGDLDDSGSPQWKWKCEGYNGGTTTNNCVANKAPLCKTYSGSYSEQPADSSATGCTIGNYADATNGTSQWNWKCSYNGATANCSAAAALTQACYEGIWQSGDPQHPEGGNIQFMTTRGQDSRMRMWITQQENISYLSGTSVTSHGVQPCR